MQSMSCADCGMDEGEGVSLKKACKSCMLVKYCNRNCQWNHWPKHKKLCKQRAAELLQIPNQLFFSALKRRFSASEIYVGIIPAENLFDI
jgi:sulfatase maturation enzyme AslB (radical SAM superfamily)